MAPRRIPGVVEVGLPFHRRRRLVGLLMTVLSSRRTNLFTFHRQALRANRRDDPGYSWRTRTALDPVRPADALSTTYGTGVASWSIVTGRTPRRSRGNPAP